MGAVPQKKKIAIVMGPMVFGGSEKALIEMLKVFDYERFDVTLFLKDGTGEMRDMLDQRVTVKYWPNITPKQALLENLRSLRLLRVANDLLCRVVCRLFLTTWQINGWFGAKCLPMIDDAHFDCAIAYHGTTPSVVVGALHRIHSTKKILWIHAYVICPEKYWRWFDKQYDKFHRICCVSSSMCEMFSHMFPSSGKKTAVFHNILDVAEVKAKSAVPLDEAILPCSLVTVGRLSTEKGQDMIPAVARSLLDDGYDIHWYIVGEGYLREKIQQRAREYHVEDRVILLGSKENPYPYIKNCDIYVQTSLLEGWGLTIQEAKILGRPIVSTPLPAIKEQIRDGVTGLLAADTSPEAMYRRIKYLLDHPELRHRIVAELSSESYNCPKELQELYAFIEAPSAST